MPIVTWFFTTEDLESTEVEFDCLALYSNNVDRELSKFAFSFWRPLLSAPELHGDGEFLSPYAADAEKVKAKLRLFAVYLSVPRSIHNLTAKPC